MTDPLHPWAFELGRDRQTPFFMFAPGRTASALSRLRAFTESLKLDTEIFYSYKTNYLPALCAWLRDAEVGAEVTSPIEWRLATGLHAPENIVVNGLGKTADGWLAELVADSGSAPRLVNLETDTELDVVLRRKPDAELMRVGLRVAVPDAGEFGRDPSERWSLGRDKFGWDVNGSGVSGAARRLSNGPASVRLEALHLHFGSQLVDPKRYDLVLRKTIGLLERLQVDGITITTLDLGGGIASGMVAKHRSGPLFAAARLARIDLATRVQKVPDLDGVAAVINGYARRLASLGVTRLLFEPGRYLAEPSMLAVARIIAVRDDGPRRVAVLDIGTNSLKCWRSNEIRPISFSQRLGESAAQVELVGPLCHRSDTFGSVNAPSNLEVGGLVCFDAVGAYTLGDWIANTWRRPAVYHEDGTTLWAAQDFVDLLRPADDVGATP
jgi:diaminopimelate decarboxylase